ncbi:MAG TPA: YdaS family helix-turn-helix protein [Bryobacteraceae bacterium]|nr:YdaS family helix-turn-helix protein [Bryobacteraceae bacterium]
MTLAEFIKSTSLTDGQLAKQLGCSTSALRKWRYGQRIPRPEQKRRIAEVTEGKVTPNDFMVLPSSEGAAA